MAVPFDGFCILTMDPATLLPTGEVVENGLPPAATRRMTEIEIRGEDFNAFGALARSKRPVASLSEATGGDLDRGVRHRELKRPNGLGDELRAVLAGDSATWGALTLLRASDRRHFTPDDAALLASVSRYLAKGLRRAMLFTTLHAERQDDVESHELAPLIADAYELTDRERMVTQLVAQGHPTSANRRPAAHLAPDGAGHLKSIFEKVGVGTRGELIASVFFEHYAPRLTDGAPIGSDGWFAG